MLKFVTIHLREAKSLEKKPNNKAEFNLKRIFL